jgi:hypothetical protein
MIDEMKARGRVVEIHGRLKVFLNTVDKTAAPRAEAAIVAAIIKALDQTAKDLAGDWRGAEYELGAPLNPKITGSATPKPSVVAVSFQVRYPLIARSRSGAEEAEHKAKLDIDGVCSYTPSNKEASDIEVRGWTKNLGGSEVRGFSSTGWNSPETLEREFDPRRNRLI